jgi:hypothetical protein
VPITQNNPVSEPIIPNQQFPGEAMVSMMTWFSTGFSNLASTLEGHQSAIAKKIENNIKEIRQICTRTQEQQKNISPEHQAKPKVRRKKCAGFVPDPDDCGDVPTGHSKVAYNAFKVSSHLTTHRRLAANVRLS